MERLTFTARIEQEASGSQRHFTARVDSLDLEGEGESLEEAQEHLVQAMRAWIETHDGTETLEQALEAAGFPGVGEDTELELEFEDSEHNAE